MTSQLPIAQVAQALYTSTRLVVFTGAGVSKESGLHTFRDALDGLWAKYDPQELATPMAFERNPKLVWDWYMYRRAMLADAAPNPGHYAIVELEAYIAQVTVVTQNIDGFHAAVGSTDVIELHGNLVRDKCFANCQGTPTIVDTTQLTWDKDAGPPRCPHCQQAYVRPDVVWFHEILPEEALRRAMDLSAEADTMLVVGTSGVVYPANRLPVLAKRAGATVIDVNPTPSQITGIADYYLPAPSGEVLPQVLAALKGLKAGNADQLLPGSQQE